MNGVYHFRGDQKSAQDERSVFGKRKTDPPENKEEKKADIGKVLYES
jgi:hypothetical protein